MLHISCNNGIRIGGKIVRMSLVFAALLSGTCAYGQSTGPRDLAELKREAQLRADQNLPPVGGVKSEDMREAMAGLNSLEPDAWAAVFIRIGDRYVEKAKTQQATAPHEAGYAQGGCGRDERQLS